MTLRVEVPVGCVEERRYALGLVLNDLLGLEVPPVELQVHEGAAGVRITSVDGAGGEVLIGDDLFSRMSTDWFDRRWLPAGPLERWPTDGAGLEEAALVDGTLPVLYGHPTLERDGDTTRLGLDLFGAAFAMVTRYEEVVAGDHDDHGRFPAAASIAAREGFLDRPLLDEYGEVLWAVLRSHWPRLERRPPEPRLWLSHDVDIPRSAGSGVTGLAKWVAADVLRRREPALAAQRVRAYPKARHGLTPEDPANSFDLIMDVSERHGLRSAFYFIPTEGSRAVDARYRLDEPWVRALLRRIHERDHEIGLHASYETFRDPDLTRSEFASLRTVAEGEGIVQPAWGGRQHYLRWDPTTTWRNWDGAGLDYDSTMTFHDCVGFRSGTCREHGLFDLRTRTPLRLRERPVVAMDATLKGYMGLDDDELVRRVTVLAERCRLVKGPMSLLWHNHNLASSSDRRTYAALVEAIA
jgi:hypothetical protein